MSTLTDQFNGNNLKPTFEGGKWVGFEAWKSDEFTRTEFKIDLGRTIRTSILGMKAAGYTKDDAEKKIRDEWDLLTQLGV